MAREITDEELEAANRRWEEEIGSGPLAESVRYDRKANRIVIELKGGASFAFPPQMAQGLENATPEQLEAGEIQGGGYGLYWEELDADLAVPSLLNGVFGTRKWMASQGGRSTSAAKAAAARENGKKGGRPKRAA